MASRRLAKVIRELRGEMTQEQLAKLASRGGPPKVTRSYIALLETGRKNNPSIAIMRKIAKALEVPVGRLLE
jgi:transcriptional regulator with XRE-family HTH domain